MHGRGSLLIGGRIWNLRERSIFFGYIEGVKGYMLLYSFTNTILIQRSVKFEEGPSLTPQDNSISLSPPLPLVDLGDNFSDFIYDQA
jgi:hypothetical protein